MLQVTVLISSQTPASAGSHCTVQSDTTVGNKGSCPGDVGLPGRKSIPLSQNSSSRKLDMGSVESPSFLGGEGGGVWGRGCVCVCATSLHRVK